MKQLLEFLALVMLGYIAIYVLFLAPIKTKNVEKRLITIEDSLLKKEIYHARPK